MQCITCKTEISSSFRHAIARNECPACGGSIMDEESLAIIEHLSNTLSGGATLREGTAQSLAMMLYSLHDISLRDTTLQAVTMPQHVPQPKNQQQDMKVAPPSAMSKVEKKSDPSVITAEEVMEEGISDSERDKIMEEIVKKRYGMADQVEGIDIEDEHDVSAAALMEQQNNSVFSEGGVNPILEQERLMRLAKQRQAMEGGGGSFRRSG